ncbi:MAG: hypothetical protein WC312_04285 [Candidatus Omnitrophota bacterium]
MLKFKILYKLNNLSILLMLVFCYAGQARAEEPCLRSSLQDDTIQRVKAGYELMDRDKITDAAGESYIQAGFLFQEFYNDFKASDKKGPFIVLCLGHPVSGKSTILEQLKIVLEESGKKVIKVGSGQGEKKSSLTWGNYKQMIELYKDYDIVLFETMMNLPEGPEDVGLFIFMSIDEYKAAKRYDDLVGNYGAYAASKGFERYYAEKQKYPRVLPDINIDTSNSNLTPEMIKGLIAAGMVKSGKRYEIRQSALRLIEEVYRFRYNTDMPEYTRDTYQKLIAYKDRYPVEGKKVLYIGNSFSDYPLIDAALGAKEVIVTDLDPKLITLRDFIAREQADAINRIRIIDTPADIMELDSLPAGLFYQVNMWNVLNDENFSGNPVTALANCLSKIEDGGGLWINNWARLGLSMADVKYKIPELADGQKRIAALKVILDLPSEAYDMGVCYYYQISSLNSLRNLSGRTASESL